MPYPTLFRAFNIQGSQLRFVSNERNTISKADRNEIIMKKLVIFLPFKLFRHRMDAVIDPVYTPIAVVLSAFIKPNQILNIKQIDTISKNMYKIFTHLEV